MAVEQSTKFCTKCRTDHPISMFSKQASHKDGLRSHCKLCISKKSAEYISSNREKIAKYKREYYTANREKELEKSRKHYAENRDKERVRKNRYHIANREKVSERGRKYRAANRENERLRVINRRARLRTSGRLSSGISEKLFKLQRGKCACCGKPLGNDFHRDHIMPLALGGSNTDDNIQLLCKTCNLSKHAKHPADFMRQRGFLI